VLFEKQFPFPVNSVVGHTNNGHNWCGGKGGDWANWRGPKEDNFESERISQMVSFI
jgi:hypothetical protein